MSLRADHELLVTIEENVLAGRLRLRRARAPVRPGRAGLPPASRRIPDRYVTTASPTLLKEEIGFTAERVAERSRATLARNDPVRAERL